MKTILDRRAVRLLALLLLLLAPGAAAQGAGLRVGAARVDITPADVDPASIRDRLYVRAIVIDNGTTRAALVNADQGSVNDAVWAPASRQIATELGVPVEHILIAATHTHSGGAGDATARTQRLTAALVEAVRQARGRLQPALMGFGEGSAHLNVNRDAIHPTTQLWYQGPNMLGVSDKTVSVLSFWTAAGAPIGAFYSYAMHPVNFYLRGYTSADFPGEAARHMEAVLGPDFVPVFAQAPSGDQNPLYTRISSPVPADTQLVPLRRPNAVTLPGNVASADSVLRNVAGLDDAVRAAGVILGQEVMRVMFGASTRSNSADIRGAHRVVTCPGRARLDDARQGVPGQYSDGPDVNIRVGMLRLGRVALATVNAEVYTDIGLRLKRESPLANLLPISIANGSAGSGYIPTDAAFSTYTFQVLGSRLKPGCAENGIANAALELADATSGL